MTTIFVCLFIFVDFWFFFLFQRFTFTAAVVVICLFGQFFLGVSPLSSTHISFARKLSDNKIKAIFLEINLDSVEIKA